MHRKLEQKYPRVSVRVSKPKRLRLEALVAEIKATGKQMTLSKLTNECWDCLLTNFDCKIRQRYELSK